MQQQMSLVTLGVDDLARARRFYAEGFGWKPVFENDGIAFFQLNGLVFGLWPRGELNADMQDDSRSGAASFAMAHNVGSQADVEPAIARLVAAGGTLLRAADAPPHGGYRGYVADPDGHAWEIAWNPAWSIDADGRITFGV